MAEERGWGTTFMKWTAGLLIAWAGMSAMGVYVSSNGLSDFGAAPEGASLARMKASPQHDGQGFTNTNEPEPLKLKMGEMFEEYAAARREGRLREPPAPLPMDWLDGSVLGEPSTGDVRVTWLGHSSLIIEVDGVRVLTDPMFGERASPVDFAGPRRFHPVPTSLEELPPLDGILISHDHYDHLDAGTIRRLAGYPVTFYVPLGLGAHLQEWGIPAERIVEHDWWDASELPGGVKVVSTPCQHFSGRGLTDRNRTLWTSWAIVGPEHRVWFSGDTGYTEEFRQIGERLGPFDLALVEAGAYNKAWPTVHLGPDNALKAIQDVGAKHAVPVHWGTFDLSTHAWDDPAEELLKRTEPAGITLHTPVLGRPMTVPVPGGMERWWRSVSGEAVAGE